MDVLELWEKNGGLRFLDAAALAELGQSRGTWHQAAQRFWDAWHGQLLALATGSSSAIRPELARLWAAHQKLIKEKGDRMSKIQSAGDMYRCWPSRDWFNEGPMPFKEEWSFECGDSSYNIWIMDLEVAAACIGRIATDLYLRELWPKPRHTPEQANRLAGLKSAEELAGLLAEVEAQVHQDSDWEFSMRPCRWLMDQIWWSDRHTRRRIDPELVKARPYLSEGALLPRRPQPKQGLSLMKGQESAFLTWDKHEVWVYACYVD